MGKGKKTTRGMNVLVRVLMRKRQLKKASPKSFVRPEGLGSSPQASKEENTAE